MFNIRIRKKTEINDFSCQILLIEGEITWEIGQAR